MTTVEALRDLRQRVAKGERFSEATNKATEGLDFFSGEYEAFYVRLGTEVGIEEADEVPMMELIDAVNEWGDESERWHVLDRIDVTIRELTGGGEEGGEGD